MFSWPCVVVGWYLGHPEHTAKIKVMPKRLPYSDVVRVSEMMHGQGNLI